MRPSVVHVGAWGPVWVGRARAEALRCLRANLPELECLGPVRVILSTDDPTLASELDAAEVSLIKAPDNVSESRDLMGACEADAIDIAQAAGADFFPLCADHVFSARHLAGAKMLLEWRRAVVGTSIRCARAAFHAQDESVGFHDRVMASVHPWMARYRLGATAPALVHQIVLDAADGKPGFDVSQGQAALFALRTEGLPPGFHRPPRAECQLAADLCEDFDRDLFFVEHPEGGVGLVGLDDEEMTTFGAFPVSEASFGEAAGVFMRSGRDAALWIWSAAHRVAYRA